jgi:hypothetical protein
MKVANGALAAFFLHFGADDFPFKIPVKKGIKIVVFLLGHRRFWSCNLCSRCA